MKTIQGDECFETLDLKQYLIFYFTASWCGPCQAIAPKIQELSDQLDPEKIRFFKIDIDEEENNEICDICKIKSVPSFLLFKDCITSTFCAFCHASFSTFRAVERFCFRGFEFTGYINSSSSFPVSSRCILCPKKMS